MVLFTLMQIEAQYWVDLLSSSQVCRDRALSKWQFQEKITVHEDGYGSGYPGGQLEQTAFTSNTKQIHCCKGRKRNTDNEALTIFSITKDFKLQKMFFFLLDPKTKRFLSDSMDKVFGFPQFVRFGWSTASVMLQKSAVDVQW